MLKSRLVHWQGLNLCSYSTGSLKCDKESLSRSLGKYHNVKWLLKLKQSNVREECDDAVLYFVDLKKTPTTSLETKEPKFLKLESLKMQTIFSKQCQPGGNKMSHVQCWECKKGLFTVFYFDDIYTVWPKTDTWWSQNLWMVGDGSKNPQNKDKYGQCHTYCFVCCCVLDPRQKSKYVFSSE